MIGQKKNVHRSVSSRLTIIPVRRQTPLPQYVLGTMSPYPMVRKVIEINHMAPRKLLVTSWLSWYLQHAQEEDTLWNIDKTDLNFHSTGTLYWSERKKKSLRILGKVSVITRQTSNCYKKTSDYKKTSRKYEKCCCYEKRSLYYKKCPVITRKHQIRLFSRINKMIFFLGTRCYEKFSCINYLFCKNKISS